MNGYSEDALIAWCSTCLYPQVHWCDSPEDIQSKLKEVPWARGLLSSLWWEVHSSQIVLLGHSKRSEAIVCPVSPQRMYGEAMWTRRRGWWDGTYKNQNRYLWGDPRSLTYPQ